MQYYKANEITATNRRFAEPQNDTICCEAALNTQTVRKVAARQIC